MGHGLPESRGRASLRTGMIVDIKNMLSPLAALMVREVVA